MENTTLSATDGSGTATLRNVAFGELLLCGGQVALTLAPPLYYTHPVPFSPSPSQSNMGFGMCGARSASQTSGT